MDIVLYNINSCSSDKVHYRQTDLGDMRMQFIIEKD